MAPMVSLLVVTLSSIHVSSESGCKALFTVVMLVLFGASVATAVVRPNRNRTSNVLSAGMYASLGALVAMQIQTTRSDPRSVSPSLRAAFMFINSFVTTARTVHTAATTVYETRVCSAFQDTADIEVLASSIHRSSERSGTVSFTSMSLMRNIEEDDLKDDTDGNQIEMGLLTNRGAAARVDECAPLCEDHLDAVAEDPFGSVAAPHHSLDDVASPDASLDQAASPLAAPTIEATLEESTPKEEAATPVEDAIEEVRAPTRRKEKLTKAATLDAMYNESVRPFQLLHENDDVGNAVSASGICRALPSDARLLRRDGTLSESSESVSSTFSV